MRQRNLFLLFSLMIILSGCSTTPHEETETNNQEPEYELTLESAVDQEDCFVCGNWIFLCGSTAVPEERIPPIQRQETAVPEQRYRT